MKTIIQFVVKQQSGIIYTLLSMNLKKAHNWYHSRSTGVKLIHSVYQAYFCRASLVPGEKS